MARRARSPAAPASAPAAPGLALDGAIWWRAGEANWGGRSRIALLAAIGEHGSITAAAKAVGMSYKAAWDAIDAMNNLAGEALVARSTGGKGGGGTQLTARAQRLIAHFDFFEQAHRRFVANLARLGPDVPADLDLMRRMMIRTSARNKFAGEVTHIAHGAVNDEVRIAIAGGLQIVATVTHESVLALELAPGAPVLALVKAPAVMLGVPADGEGGLRLSARNQLPGTVDRIVPGAVNSEVTLSLAGGGAVTAIVTCASVDALALAPGKPAYAIFDAASVILAVV